MRVSPNLLITVFIFLGVSFVLLAINSADETIWNVTTIVFMLLATMEFMYAFRFYEFQRKMKQKQKQGK